MERSFPKRLIAAQASILLVLAAAVAIALFALRSLQQNAAQTSQIHERLALLDQLRTDARDLARLVRRFLLTGDPQERQRLLAIEARVNKGREQLRDGIDREEARELERELDDYVSAMIRAMSEDSSDLAPALLRFEEGLARTRSKIGTSFDELTLRNRSRLRSAESARQLVRDARWALSIAGILGALLVVGMTFSVTRLFARHRERGRRAESAAERAEAARKDLLAASDELRMPLDAIIARCTRRRAMKPHDDAELPEFETIEAEARRALRMLGELLEVTAVHSGRVSLDRRSCAAASLVDRAIEHHREAARHRGIRLRSEVPDRISICADPERVGHVLVILLGEAIAKARIGAEISVTAAPSYWFTLPAEPSLLR